MGTQLQPIAAPQVCFLARLIALPVMFMALALLKSLQPEERSIYYMRDIHWRTLNKPKQE